MPADTDKDPRKAGLCLLGEIDDLGNVRQIVAGERDDVRPPALDHAVIGGVVLDLQIDQLDLMAGLARRLGHQLETDRLEPQKDFGVMEDTGKHAEEPHSNSPLAIIGRRSWPDATTKRAPAIVSTATRCE